MIAYLEGEILQRTTDAVICKVGGIGYHVTIGQRSAQVLAGHTGMLKLWIEENVRDGQVFLFGFLTQEEVSWFRWLTLVPGVGGKVALAILSSFSLQELHSIILEERDAQLRSAEGVGAKLATRIVHELRDKAVKWGPLQASTPEQNEALEALCALGYRLDDARHALSAITVDPQASTQDRIRLALSYMTGRL